MPSRRAKSPRLSRSQQHASAAFSAEGMDHLDSVSAVPGAMIDSSQPPAEWTLLGPTNIFARARGLYDTNDFVGSWVNLRRVCFDDDLRFTGENDKLTKWLDANRIRAWVRRLNGDIWHEFLLNDNAVVFWMEPQEGKLPRPVVLDGEICDYSGTVGGEVLKVKVPKKSLSPADKANLNARWIDAYTYGKTLTINPDLGEYFKVLTRGKSGQGFSSPRIRQALPLLGTRNNLQQADWAGSDQHKNVIMQVQVGREMKFAEAVNHQTIFSITKDVKQEIWKEIRTKRGSFKAVTDIAINFFWKYLEPSFFDSKKYQGTQAMLDRWGGAGMAMLATGEPWLMPFFRQEGLFDRRQVGSFIDELLADPDFLPIRLPRGQPLSVAWNPNTFEDIKMLLEKLRFATGSGIMSWQTARGDLGLDNDTEAGRLKAEGQDRETCEPPFEPKQGMLSGEAAPGRPPGGPGGLPVQS